MLKLTINLIVMAFLVSVSEQQFRPGFGGGQGFGRPGGNQGGNQGFGRPGGNQGFGRPGGNQGFGRPGGNQGGNQGFGRPGGNQGFGRPGGNQGFGGPGGQDCSSDNLPDPFRRLNGNNCQGETRLNDLINSLEPANQAIARNLVTSAQQLKSATFQTSVQAVRTSQASLFTQFQSVDPAGYAAFNNYLNQESSFTTCAQRNAALTTLQNSLQVQAGTVLYRKIDCYVHQQARTSGRTAFDQFFQQNQNAFPTTVSTEESRKIRQFLFMLRGI